jgi:hypothetical protein
VVGPILVAVRGALVAVGIRLVGERRPLVGVGPRLVVVGQGLVVNRFGHVVCSREFSRRGRLDADFLSAAGCRRASGFELWVACRDAS